ncbi:MAG TPA: zf-TFIIB domain-containing protein [Polyangia bacterium]|jgi:Zn-finger nucleic acid-binding protein|nr:zf-TFIIB domain-containing protein [Polyangia bacterium]
MNLTCVKCTSVLDKARVGDVEVDLCPSCGGLWLDHGEIERLGHGKPEDLGRLRTALAGTASPEPVSEASTSCPACAGQLLEVELGPVHIEHCNKCYGIFLDKGELDEAVQAVSGSTVRQVMTLAGSFARELAASARS